VRHRRRTDSEYAERRRESHRRWKRNNPEKARAAFKKYDDRRHLSKDYCKKLGEEIERALCES
jgi:hypothetical protein